MSSMPLWRKIAACCCRPSAAKKATTALPAPASCSGAARPLDTRGGAAATHAVGMDASWTALDRFELLTLGGLCSWRERGGAWYGCRGDPAATKARGFRCVGAAIAAGVFRVRDANGTLAAGFACIDAG
mmetsp:Transcript_150070/g.418138  ORF Transcript_150070/g.418138 Transcript_150070/m.418138 type:complete len:129 (+) Transcript_150070:428-814(+)